jgi:hypothetical protein
MGRIARYTNFYDPRIFDDTDSDQEPEEEFSNPIAMKDVPAHEFKKMLMLKTLMDTWAIDPAQMVIFLQRSIFKKYRDVDNPDINSYREAVKQLTALHDRMRHRDTEKNRTE